MAYPISDVTRRIIYSGSAGVGPYSFSFEILEQTDVAVYKNSTLLTLTTDYSVTINADGTGSVTLVSAASASDQITLFGDRAIERSTDFVTGGDLFANSLNEELDSQTIFAQQIDEKADRAIKAPITDPTTVDMTLPSKADRADKILAFDVNGNPAMTSEADIAAGIRGAIVGANYVVTNATGNGSSVAFTVSSAPGSKSNIQIYIDGVYQNKNTFSISGTTVTFTEAPPSGAAIEFVVGYAIGVGGGAAEITYTPAGTGAVTTTVQAKLRETVSVKDFGAVGDGVTDDTAAIQAAFTACAASGQGLHFPAGTYNASSALTMGNHDLFMEGKLVYTASTAITFLTIANPNRREIHLRVARSAVDWSNDAMIGVRVYGDTNQIYLEEVSNFAIGVQFGIVNYFSYNTVFVNFVVQNRIGLDLHNTDINSFVNQNTFIGGRCSVFTNAALNGFSRYGVRITSDDTYLNNNNIFYNVNFELKASLVTGGAEACPILMERGRANAFHFCRNEDATSAGIGAAIEENNSYGNFYSFAFGEDSFITYRGTLKNSYIETLLFSFGDQDIKYITLDSGPVYKRANYYNGTDQVSIDGLQFHASASSTPVSASSAATLSSTAVTLVSSIGVGTFAKLEGAQKFQVKAMGTGAFRVAVAAFDSAGTRLTSGTHITGTAANSFTYITSFGGVYRIGADITAGEIVQFSIQDSAVASIEIIVVGGTSTSLDLISLEIYADTPVTTYLSVPEMRSRDKLGTAAPSAGTWVQGDVVWNATPSAGGTMGWVCTTGGTPGTWKTFGAIAA